MGPYFPYITTPLLMMNSKATATMPKSRVHKPNNGNNSSSSNKSVQLSPHVTVFGDLEKAHDDGTHRFLKSALKQSSSYRESSSSSCRSLTTGSYNNNRASLIAEQNDTYASSRSLIQPDVPGYFASHNATTNTNISSDVRRQSLPAILERKPKPKSESSRRASCTSNSTSTCSVERRRERGETCSRTPPRERGNTSTRTPPRTTSNSTTTASTTTGTASGHLMRWMRREGSATHTVSSGERQRPALHRRGSLTSFASCDSAPTIASVQTMPSRLDKKDKKEKKGKKEKKEKGSKSRRRCSSLTKLVEPKQTLQESSSTTSSTQRRRYSLTDVRDFSSLANVASRQDRVVSSLEKSHVPFSSKDLQQMANGQATSPFSVREQQQHQQHFLSSDRESSLQGKALRDEPKCPSNRSVDTTSTRSLTSASSRSLSSTPTGWTNQASSSIANRSALAGPIRAPTPFRPPSMAQAGITPEQLARQHLQTQQQKAKELSAAKLERAIKKEQRRLSELEFPGTLSEFLCTKVQSVDPTYESDEGDDMFSVFQWSVSGSTVASHSVKSVTSAMTKRSSLSSRSTLDASIHSGAPTPTLASAENDKKRVSPKERSSGKSSSFKTRDSSVSRLASVEHGTGSVKTKERRSIKSSSSISRDSSLSRRRSMEKETDSFSRLSSKSSSSRSRISSVTRRGSMDNETNNVSTMEKRNRRNSAERSVSRSRSVDRDEVKKKKKKSSKDIKKEKKRSKSCSTDKLERSARKERKDDCLSASARHPHRSYSVD